MRSGELYCKSVALRTFPEFIRELGGNPERLFDAVGLNISDIKGDNYIDWAKACALLELSADVLNEPCLGIKWANYIPKDFLNSGPTLMIAALTPNMREFLDLTLAYQKLHTNGLAYNYTEDFGANQAEFEIQFHPFTPPCRQFSEHIMAACILMLRHHFGEGEILKLCFQHSCPQDLSLHEEIFQCPIEFDTQKTMAFAARDLLDLKLSGKLKSFRSIVKSYLNFKINKNPRFKTSIAQTVELLLPTIFGARKSSLNDVAKILEISPKKLQRLLHQEGVTFSNIIDNVRRNMTTRLLYESDISIFHLSGLLDYSSSEAFNAACQRWFGVSPREYRKAARQ